MCIHGANEFLWFNSEYVVKYIPSFKRVETYIQMTIKNAMLTSKKNVNKIHGTFSN